MDVVILLVFISLLLVAAGLVFFIYRLREGDFEHGERLALAPLNDGEAILEPHRDQNGRGARRGNHSLEEQEGDSQHANS